MFLTTKNSRVRQFHKNKYVQWNIPNNPKTLMMMASSIYSGGTETTVKVEVSWFWSRSCSCMRTCACLCPPLPRPHSSLTSFGFLLGLLKLGPYLDGNLFRLFTPILAEPWCGIFFQASCDYRVWAEPGKNGRPHDSLRWSGKKHLTQFLITFTSKIKKIMK